MALWWIIPSWAIPYTCILCQTMKVFRVPSFPMLGKIVFCWRWKESWKVLFFEIFFFFFRKLLHDCQGWNPPSASLLSPSLSCSPSPSRAHLTVGSRWWWSTKWLNAAANFRGAFNNEFRFKLPWLDEACSILLEPVAGKVAADEM